MIAANPHKPDRVAKARATADVAEARMRATLARKQTQLLNMGDYTSARRNRTRGGDRPKTTSADAQLDNYTTDRIRADAQRMMRKSPLIRAMIRRRVDRAGGSGLRYQATTADKEWNRLAEAKFAIWAERYADIRGMVGFGSLQRMALTSMHVDGDCGFIMAAGGGTAPEDVLRLQGIEAARIGGLSGPAHSSGAGGPALVGGIELDSVGRPVRFMVLDYNTSGNGVSNRGQWVDASDFLYICSPTRFSQTRGESRLAALPTINEGLGDYIDATITSAKVAACQAGFVKTAHPSAMQTAINGTTETTYNQQGQSQSERWEQMQPGQIRYLAPGEDVGQLKPEQPTTTFDSFVRMLVRIAASDLDMPLEMALLDHSQATAYAGRAALSLMKAPIESDREVLRRFGAAVVKQVIGLMIANGELPFVEDWQSHKFIGPADPSFEPEKEYGAAVLAISNNLTTKRHTVESFGFDFDEVLQERAIEVEQERAAGIAPPMMPGSMPSGPDASASSAPDPQPTPEPAGATP